MKENEFYTEQIELNSLKKFILSEFSLDKNELILERKFQTKHILSHRVLLCDFYTVFINTPFTLKAPYLFTHQPETFPISRLMEKYLERHKAE